MKKIYFAFIPSLFFLLTACKKDNTNNDNLISGTWELYKAETTGYINPTFVNGYFTFKSGGRLEYKDMRGNIYDGSWNRTYHEDTKRTTLYISVEDPIPNTRFEFFDDMLFTNTDHFEAYIINISDKYTFWFKR